MNKAFAQENSPYSRYGLGDNIPSQNIISRGMGGLAIAYSDFGLGGMPFSINITNPAALGNITKTKNFSNIIFDVGAEVDYRTLRSTTSSDKFLSKNLVMSYMQLAFPVSGKKLENKGISWAMAFGLQPLNRINYQIEQNARISGIDSINTIFEGSGGVHQINVSTGFRKTGKGKNKNELNIGISTGYTFGSKDYSTKRSFINDSVAYYKSNSEVSSNFGGVFLKAGLQYECHFPNKSMMRWGTTISLQQNLNARETKLDETFGYDYTNSPITISTIRNIQDAPGKVVLPMNMGLGCTYYNKNKQWMIGAEGEWTNWSAYRYYNTKDSTIDNWTLRIGAEYYPASGNAGAIRYAQYIKYRAGFYYGLDYIRILSNRNNFAFTGGLSIPLTSPRYIQTRGEYVSLNASIEAGARGNKQSYSIRETYTRINFGISMNARWFQKRIYD